MVVVTGGIRSSGERLVSIVEMVAVIFVTVSSSTLTFSSRLGVAGVVAGLLVVEVLL